MQKKILETSRLRLVPANRDEEEILIPFFANPDVSRYLGDGKPRDAKMVRAAVEKHEEHWEAFGHGFFSIYEKETGEFIGRCGLVHLAMQHDHPDVEIGYMFYPKSWGKGYATEVAKELLRWGFEELKLPFILGVCRKENIPSRRVLEKLGMKHEKEDVYPKTDALCDYYRVTKDEAILR
jgi:RimJ/RimL family protein N-acetyltransferase